MVLLDMFRFEISLIQTNEDKHTVRNMRLELEEKTGPEMQIYLGSTRLRMVLKARKWTRCSKRVCVNRREKQSKD